MSATHLSLRRCGAEDGGARGLGAGTRPYRWQPSRVCCTEQGRSAAEGAHRYELLKFDGLWAVPLGATGRSSWQQQLQIPTVADCQAVLRSCKHSSTPEKVPK